MNLTEARIIMICQKEGEPRPVQLKEIRRIFKFRHGYGDYSFISRKCRELEEDYYLERREINWGKKKVSPKMKGNPSYYAAVPYAIKKARERIELESEKLKEKIRKGSRSSNKMASLKAWLPVAKR